MIRWISPDICYKRYKRLFWSVDIGTDPIRSKLAISKRFVELKIKIYKKNPIVATVIQIDVTQQPIDEFL